MAETIRYGDLRGMLQYVPQFRDRTFVIAIDGGVLASPNFSNILLDIAALRSLDINLVLVNGASHQIRALAEQRNVEISNDDGTGLVDEATLELSIDAITRLTSTLMQQLTAKGLRTATANALIAHRAGVIKGVDQGFTGRVDRVDVGSLTAMLGEGIIPVIPPLAYDGEGNTLRINSDEAASGVAVQLGASKAIFLLGDGKCTGEGMPKLRQLSIKQTRDYLEDCGDLCPSIRSKLNHAVNACEAEVQRAHLIYGEGDDAPLLAELFNNEGIGIMIFADAYHKLRAADRSDVEELISMMRPGVAHDRLLFRSREEILDKLSDYHVIEVDGHVVGSVAVHYYPKDDVAELACLFIKRSHENQGYGQELVEFAVRQARSLGAKQLFALSTQAYEFFEQKCGFTKGDAEALPADRREFYAANSRNSKILVKELKV